LLREKPGACSSLEEKNIQNLKQKPFEDAFDAQTTSFTEYEKVKKRFQNMAGSCRWT
jgi:hypothetical protein